VRSPFSSSLVDRGHAELGRSDSDGGSQQLPVHRFTRLRTRWSFCRMRT